MSEKIDEIRSRISGIKQEMLEMGDLCPGSLSRQTRSWGKKYWQLSYTHRGRGHTEYVGCERVGEVEKQIDNYRRFRELSLEMVDLYLAISKENKEQARRPRNKLANTPSGMRSKVKSRKERS